jgi:hypothetical protein
MEKEFMILLILFGYVLLTKNYLFLINVMRTLTIQKVFIY